MITKYYLLILVLISNLLISQSPGGVSAGLTSWLKIDNASSVVGNPISSWSGSGSTASFSLTQTVATKRPTYNNGSTNYKRFSYMPYATFISANQTFLSKTTLTADLVGSTGTVIYIGDGIVGTAISYRYGTNRHQFKPNFRVQTTSNGTTGYTFDFTLSSEYPNTSAKELTCFGAGSNQKMRYNSVLTTTCNNCNSTTYNPAVAAGYVLGANPQNNEYCNNSIAEVITYSTTLSSADFDKIESYLSIKYGITRGGNLGTSTIYNYVASDGTIIYDKSLNSGYNINIAGIGRDDNSGLDKRQSMSVNNNELLTIGNLVIASENSTNPNPISGNKQFLTWGNNGQPATLTNTNVPEGFVNRLEKVWKAQSTNFSQLTTFGFEQSLLPVGTSSTSLQLLIDDDGDFSNATLSYSVTAINGGRIEFSGQNFDSNTKMYFTLGTCSSYTPVFTPSVACENQPLQLNVTSPTFTSSNISYNWSGPSSYSSSLASPTITSASFLNQGTYTLGLSVNGCFMNFSSQPIAIDTAIALSVTGNNICSGQTTTLTAIGAASYTWMPSGLTTSSITVNPLTTTAYSISASNNICVTNTVLVVNVSPSPTITATGTLICSGETATVTVNGATSYTWAASGLTTTSITANPLTTSGYSITGSLNNCNTDAIITVSVNPKPSITASGNLICSGETATVTANGATSYTWVPSGITTNSITLNPLTTTGYSITGSLNNCNTDAIITVTVIQTPTLSVSNVTICENQIATLTVSGANSYTWFPSNTTGNTYTSTPTSSQTITIFGTINNCSNSTNCFITVNELPTDDYLFDLSQSECTGILEFDLISGGKPGYSYNMNFGDGNTSNFTNQINHQYEPGTYQTTLTMTQNGCINTISKSVNISDVNPDIYIPNTFTPNNDNVNDYYLITGDCVVEFEIVIFNRWGAIVFKSNNINDKWNGIHNKESVSEGVYSYVITYKKSNSKGPVKKAGTITIFR